MPNKIIGDKGEIIIFGDLHLSAQFQGTHKNYIENCYKVMELIRNHCEKERNLKGVIFLGDLIGVKERKISNHVFLSRVMTWFRGLGDMCDGNIWSVRGNHDEGEFPDYQILIQQGLIKEPDDGTLDFSFLRFHFLNYGEESRRLKLDESRDNIVLGHADYTVEGKTPWYGGSDSVDITKIVNLKGVQLVISGHIHSPNVVGGVMIDGGEGSCDLIYPGCPTRVSERFDDCYYVRFSVDKEDTTLQLPEMGLWSAEEEFLPKDSIVEGVYAEVDSKRLKDIIDIIISSNLTQGDYKEQVLKVPGYESKVKELACSYLDKAINKE